MFVFNLYLPHVLYCTFYSLCRYILDFSQTGIASLLLDYWTVGGSFSSRLSHKLAIIIYINCDQICENPHKKIIYLSYKMVLESEV